MAVEITDRGHNNRVAIDQAIQQHGNGTILLDGDNSVIDIGAGCVLSNARIQLGPDCVVSIGEACNLANLHLVAAKAGQVRIGRATSFTSDGRLYLHEPGRIEIGEECLLGSGVLFTVSDMHSLIDVVSGERVNAAADIIIGDRVWLGAEVAVLKGVSIGAGSAVGFRATVTRNLPANCLAVGAPARVVREGVTWLGTL